MAHDCEIADRVVLANAIQLGGHVRIGEGAVVSGMTGVHQFASIGAGAFIGGGLRVDQVLPSRDIAVIGAGVFAADPNASRHRPVYVDINP